MTKIVVGLFITLLPILSVAAQEVDLERFGWIAEDAQTCSVQIFFEHPGTDPNSTEDAIITALNSAQEVVYIAMYVFSDDNLGRAVIRAAQRGVTVQVLLDDSFARREYSELWGLCEANIPVRIVQHREFHHKFVIIDNILVITGSYNWSDAADTRNWENTVFIWSRSSAALFVEEFISIWEKYTDNPFGKVVTGCE